MNAICPVCKTIFPSSKIHSPHCGTYIKPICERAGCSEPATQHAYALGYVASVCETHYAALANDPIRDCLEA